MILVLFVLINSVIGLDNGVFIFEWIFWMVWINFFNIFIFLEVVLLLNFGCIIGYFVIIREFFWWGICFYIFFVINGMIGCNKCKIWFKVWIRILCVVCFEIVLFL